MGKKAHLQVLVLFRIKNFLDCRRIWLTLDGEERNVAQRCLQFVSDSMKVARSKISMQTSLIIEVVTRHSQIAVWWTKKVYLHPLVSILLMEKQNQMNTSAAAKSWNSGLSLVAMSLYNFQIRKVVFHWIGKFIDLFFFTIIIFLICVL
jgi:hypothetical protein